MGFLSELVTLIWLIVEQSAVEQPVQTRFQSTRVPGMGRALPAPRGCRWDGMDAGAEGDEQSTPLPAACRGQGWVCTQSPCTAVATLGNLTCKFVPVELIPSLPRGFSCACLGWEEQDVASVWSRSSSLCLEQRGKRLC